jgi:hypothetical protein
MVHLTAGWHSIDHHLHAHWVDFRETRQRSYVASLPANVRCADAKRFRRRLIETSHLAVAPDHDDGDIDRVQDANYIGAYRVRYRPRALRPTVLTNPNLDLARFGH